MLDNIDDCFASFTTLWHCTAAAAMDDCPHNKTGPSHDLTMSLYLFVVLRV